MRNTLTKLGNGWFVEVLGYFTESNYLTRKTCIHGQETAVQQFKIVIWPFLLHCSLTDTVEGAGKQRELPFQTIGQASSLRLKQARIACRRLCRLGGERPKVVVFTGWLARSLGREIKGSPKCQKKRDKNKQTNKTTTKKSAFPWQLCD